MYRFITKSVGTARRAAWPAIFAVMLGSLLVAGSGWAEAGGPDKPVIALDASPTPTPQRSYLPWLPNDASPTPTPTPSPTPIPAGWVADYFNNTSLTGSPAMSRVDSVIDFDWGDGSPHPAVQADNFSVRWVRTMSLAAGDYNFFTYTDNGVRLWVDDQLLIDEWHGGDPKQFISARPLAEGLHTFRMEYFDDTGRAVARLSMVNATAYPQQGEWGSWKAEYFDNRNLSGDPKVVRKDTNISFDWGAGSPDPLIPVDNFSARWTGSLFLEGGDYNFYAFADDGVVLYVDGVPVINEWRDQPPQLFRSFLNLATGVHHIRMEYFEGALGAQAQLWWHNTTKFTQWRGEYFANKDLAGVPIVVRGDSSIDFDWPGSPAEGIPHDGFSVRWTGAFTLNDGVYSFKAFADDGVRLWIDGFVGLDEWRDQAQEFTSVMPLTGGDHFIRMEYYQNSFGATARLTITKTE